MPYVAVIIKHIRVCIYESTYLAWMLRKFLFFPAQVHFTFS